MSSLFGTSVGGSQIADIGPYNLGVVVRCNVAGNITALRYYQSAPNDPFTSTLRLYVDGSAVPVRSATYTHANYYDPAHWVEVEITPYPVTAGQLVMAAYTIPGYYQALPAGLATDIVSADGNLTAPADVTFNGATSNGRFSTSVNEMPDSNYNHGLYYADLVLTPAVTSAFAAKVWTGSAWGTVDRRSYSGSSWAPTARTRWSGSAWV